MDAAYEVGKKACSSPRHAFCSTPVSHPKAWNEKMLADAHLTVPHFESDSNRLFPTRTHQGRDRRDIPRLERKLRRPSGPSPSTPNSTRSCKRWEAPTTFSTAPGHEFALIPVHGCDARGHPRGARFDVEGEQFESTRALSSSSVPLLRRRPTDDHEYVRVFGLVGQAPPYRWIRSDYVTGPVARDVQGRGSCGERVGVDNDFFGVALNSPTSLEPASPSPRLS